jgi:uncharacterized protein (TIGR02099 family)
LFYHALQIFRITVLISYRLLAVLLIALAVYVSLGKQSIAWLTEKSQPFVAQLLSNQLGQQAKFEELFGYWRKINPVFLAKDITLGEHLNIEEIELEPLILASLFTAQAKFRAMRISGIDMRVQQTENGWNVPGIAFNDDDSNSDDVKFTDLLELLLKREKIDFTDIHIDLLPSVGEPLLLDIISAEMTAKDNKRWFNAVMEVKDSFGNTGVLNLQMDVELFARSQVIFGYFNLRDLQIGPWLADAFNLKTTSFSPDVEFWFSFADGVLIDLKGRAAVKDLAFEGSDINSTLATEFFWKKAFRGYQLDIPYITLGHSERQQTLKAKVTQDGDELDADISALDLPYWLRPLGELLPDVVNGIDLKGRLAWLKLNKKGAAPIHVVSKFNHVNVSAFEGIPEIKNASGLIDTQLDQGSLKIEHLDSIHVSDVFASSWQTEQANGVLDWSFNGDWLLLQLRDSEINLVENASVWPNIQLEIPISDSNKSQGYIKVLADYQTVDMNSASQFLPIDALSAASKNWITDSVLTAEIKSGAVLYQGPFGDSEIRQRKFQMFLNAENASVKFLDEWPVLTKLNASVEVNEKGLLVNADTASLASLVSTRATLALPFETNELQVEVDSLLNGGQLDWVANHSPMTEIWGDVFNDWTIEGITKATLNLTLPLENIAGLDIKLNAQLLDHSLNIESANLSLSQLNGDIKFDSQRGLSSKNMTGIGFGGAVVANINGNFNNGTEIIIDSSGAANINEVGHWLNEPFLSSKSGSIQYQSHAVFGDQNVVHLTSDLVGLDTQLPAPFDKGAKQAMALDVIVKLGDQLDIQLQLGKELSALLLIREGVIEKGHLAFGHQASWPVDNEFNVDFTLGNLELDPWIDLMPTLLSLYASGEKESHTLDHLTLINLTAQDSHIFAQSMGQLEIDVAKSVNGWGVDFSSDTSKGILVYDEIAEVPLYVNFDYLNLSSGEKAETSLHYQTENDALNNFDFHTLPDTNFEVQRLVLDDKPMGSWRGQMFASDETLQIKNIDGVLNHLSITGDMAWLNQAGEMNTAIDLRINSQDVSAVLAGFGQKPTVSSAAATMKVDLQWPGSPMAFQYTTSSGAIDFNLLKGSIYNLDKLEGIKLVGLLNLSKIFRRLAFDFRDVFSDGMTYDEIDGQLVYDKGVVMVGKRLVVHSPAYKLRGDGSVDLLTDQIDADVVFTAPGLVLPVGIAGAFLGGVSFEILGAMLLSGSLFDDTLDTVTSVRYRLDGKLDDLNYELVQVLDNTVKGQ